MARFRFFGCHVESNLALRLPRTPSAAPEEHSAPVDLVIHRCEQPPIDSRWAREDPIYPNPRAEAEGETRVTVHESGRWGIWSFREGSVFFVSRSEIRVLPGDAKPRQLEVSLLGPVMSYWLERRGLVVLHASVVSKDDRAVAFVGANASGKTAVAASMMTQGAALLSDDLAAIDVGEQVLVRSAYPRLRLRSDLVRAFVSGAPAELARVYPGGDKFLVEAGIVGQGGFRDSSARLEQVFVLGPRLSGDEPILEPMARAESMIALIGHSFLSRPLEVLADRARRMEALATLVETVPVLRLQVPRGLESLGRTVASLVSGVSGART